MVEIDPDVVKIAADWFGVVEDDQMKVHVADGIDFVKRLNTAGWLWIKIYICNILFFIL